MSILGLLALLLVPDGIQSFGIFVADAEGSALKAPIEIVVTKASDDFITSADTVGKSTTRADRATLLLAADQPWVFRCVDPSRWCAPQTRQPGASAAVHLRAWPKAHIRGRLRPPSEAAMPRSLVVQGWGPPAEDLPLLAWHAMVDVQADGTFSFEGPQTELDFRLSAGEPWGPFYRWSLDTRGRRLDLGALHLVAGASVSAFLVDGESGEMLYGAEVNWELVVKRAADEHDRQRLSKMRYTATSDPRGLVQIHGIAPGTYRLLANAENRGQVELGPFQIDDAVELHFEEILLERLATLEVLVQPEQDPDGQPWKMTVQRDRAVAGDARYEQPVVGGKAVFHLPAGARYRLRLTSPATEDWIDRRSVNLQGDLTIELQPPLIAVKGSVVLGEEPLEAGIRIQGGQGMLKGFKSDTEGLFDGWMSWKPGANFFVHVQPKAAPYTSEFSFPAEPDLEVLELDLVLPDRSIAGRVLDTQGKPVEMAMVLANADDQQGRLSQTWSQKDGRYELGLLPEGILLTLAARGFARGSADLQIPDWGDGAGPTTDLILAEFRTLSGTIFDAGSVPIAGANIGLKTGLFASTQTSLDGSFELQISPESQQGMLTVRALGHLFWVTCIAIPEEGTLPLRLPFQGPGGRLNLELAEVEVPDGAFLTVVTPHGGSLDISTLRQWALEVEGNQDIDGATLSVPIMAPGLYALAAQYPSSPGSDTGCLLNPALLSDWVPLAQGGEATLK